MKDKLLALAFQGNWALLLPILKEHPHLINCATENKGYTVLHQAAWHGADLSIIGQLLSLGADPRIRTMNKSQTAQEIAKEKHRERQDLQYLLTAQKRTLAQLIRKAVAESPDLFSAYDGNQVICDRLIECLGWNSDAEAETAFEERVAAAFKAVTGVDLSSDRPINCGPDRSYNMHSTQSFWSGEFFKLLHEKVSRSYTIPVEKNWAVISDIFYPAPSHWGLRGDLFLWLEMREFLCHVPIPDQPEVLARIISSTFSALTGEVLDSSEPIFIKRFSRGGMSSGMVSSQFWLKEFIPLMQQRAKWLQKSWETK
ncbi:hypothetical protein VPH49_21705 [Pseudomonas luteola]|uniref:ankyrin repeat domain-containing protein n=1 Tax=Pseudomonas luteola TaxID=47886 RepID=UPI00123BC2BD|nr:ankyrin repeat domain-containing protein [Pseudomonas luteola]QEU26258.1 ankyrin repeat domain-containing protein [Pseudomonas luteola]